MTVEYIDVELLREEEIGKSVRFHAPRSQFSPDGLVSRITGNKEVNRGTTLYMTEQSYRLGKFMRVFSKTRFEDLQEVPQQNGDTIWAMGMEIDNQDFNFYLSKAEILSSIELTEVRSQAEIDAMAEKYKIERGQTYVEIDGRKYFVHMDVPLHFGTGENNDTLTNIGVIVVGDTIMSAAIAGAIVKYGAAAFDDVFGNLGTQVFKVIWTLVKATAKTVFRFVTTLFSELIGGSSMEVAFAAARGSAGATWKDAFTGVDADAVKYAFGGAVILIILLLIIEEVLHESYQNVYVYNLTSYDMHLRFPFKDEGDYHNLPSANIGAVSEPKGPGGIDLGRWYNGVAFRFQSDSEFHGLGYAMELELKDPKSQDVVKTYSCMFDIPFAGKSSLFASAKKQDNYEEYFQSKAGVNRVTSHKANDGEHEIIVTYDYLSGKHPEPEAGTELYLYNSLVVIRDRV